MDAFVASQDLGIARLVPFLQWHPHVGCFDHTHWHFMYHLHGLPHLAPVHACQASMQSFPVDHHKPNGSGGTSFIVYMKSAQVCIE